METLVVCVVVLVAMFLARVIKPLNEWRKKTKFVSAFVMVTLVVLAFVCGAIGFNAPEYDDLTWRDKNFNVLIMFFMNFSDPVGENNWLDISRFSAALFSVSAVFLVLEGLIDRAFMLLMGMSKKSVLIYGEGEVVNQLKEAVWPYGIVTEDKYVPVRGSVILLDSDDENMRFYAENENRLKGKNIYFRTENFPGLMVGAQGEDSFDSLRFFSFEEIAANLYWLKYPLCPECETLDEVKRMLDTKRDFKIAIIGNNTLMEELLLYGTQLNLYNEDSVVEYHIFGDNAEFAALHHQLDKLHIIVHEQEWFLDDAGNPRENLREFDRVLVVTQENQAKLLHQIHLVDSDVITHVFVPFENSDVNMLQTLYTEDRGGMILRPGAVMLYPWMKEACTLENMLSKERLYAAMDLNYFYDIRGDWGSLSKEYNGEWIEKYSKLSKAEQRRTRADYEKLVYKAWCGLSSYHKYSNLFSSTYAWKYRKVAKALAADEKYSMKIMRLEHMRWDNYNYFFNWKYSDVDGLLASIERDKHYVRGNGALSVADKEKQLAKLEKAYKETKGRTKDRRNKDWNWRLHEDLVPFDQLTDREARKDDFIEWLLRYHGLQKAFGGEIDV